MKSRNSEPASRARQAKAVLLAAALAMLVGGCASTGGHERDRRDPAEGFNRAMFTFNDKLDKAVLKPVAKGYVRVVPKPGRQAVGNFFSNIDDVFISVNNLLQGKPVNAASDMGRFVVNSTLGLLGTIDVASKMGLEKHDEDFGQTLGRWGVHDGPYLVLPLFGPSTLRDTFGRAADGSVDPVNQLDDVRWRNGLMALRLIDTRANLFGAEQVLDEVAADRYEFVRDAYLQRRRYNIYDGNPPLEHDEFDQDEGDVPATGDPQAPAQEATPAEAPQEGSDAPDVPPAASAEGTGEAAVSVDSPAKDEGAIDPNDAPVPADSTQ